MFSGKQFHVSHAWLSTHLCLCLYITSSYVSYSRTSMARTYLGPWKFVRDMGSSNQLGLIMVPGQEANVDNLGMSF